MANEQYTNILAEIGRQSGWSFATSTKNFSQIPGRSRRTAWQIRMDTLNSAKVKKIISDEAVRRKWAISTVQLEAEQILDGMQHNFQLSSVRFIGFWLNLIIKRLFSGIHLNLERVRELRPRFHKDSIVFLPSHRTYMDFLLLSYLCFVLDLPLPAIAAGSDFAQSPLLATALARCGAFFIRRSFGGDRLYWTVFSEYVQTQLIGAERPLEFFVEGTRSRTGKSLYPRYGLLQVVLEPYIRSQIYDIVIVPVSINYDKILEESLFAYELLGFPKPKESTSGLLRARTVLGTNFGSVFVTFAQPISVRDHFGSVFQRSIHAMQMDQQFSLSPQEKEAIRTFGHCIVGIHNRNSVVTVWPFVAAICCENQLTFVHFGRLVEKLDKWIDLAERLGCQILIRNGSKMTDLKHFISLHSNIVQLDEKTDQLQVCRPEMAENSAIAGRFSREIVSRAVSQLVLANYANQMLHLFANGGYIALAIGGEKSIPIDSLFDRFSWLQVIFNREFVCTPCEERKSFHSAVDQLINSHSIHLENDRISTANSDDLATLASIIRPFLSTYSLVIDALLTNSDRIWTEKALVEHCQKQLVGILSGKQASLSWIRYSSLSNDTLRNAFKSVLVGGSLIRTSENDCFTVNKTMIRGMATKIGLFESFHVIEKAKL